MTSVSQILETRADLSMGEVIPRSRFVFSGSPGLYMFKSDVTGAERAPL